MYMNEFGSFVGDDAIYRSPIAYGLYFIASFVVVYMAIRFRHEKLIATQRELEEQVLQRVQQLNEVIRKRLRDLLGELAPNAESSAYSEMIEQVVGWVSFEQQRSAVTRTEQAIDDSIARAITDLADRVAQVEDRFRSLGSTGEVSSLREALLLEKIDQFGRRIERLEGRMLDRWDVALVVASIFAGVITVFSAVLGLLKIFEII